MDKLAIGKVSAIVPCEETLEQIVNELTEKYVDRHAISIQGSPAEIAGSYGAPYVDPDIIQKSNHPPVREPFLWDDFGWVLGFSFAIPLVVCIIIGIFVIGDVRSSDDNFFYGIFGAIVGSAIGLFCFNLVKNHRKNIIKKQEEKGGFVLWVTVADDQQGKEIIQVLQKYNALHIAFVAD